MCTLSSGPRPEISIDSSNSKTWLRNATGHESVVSFISKIISEVLRWLGLVAIAFYRVVLAPSMGGVCRFEPSCSRYAEEAFRDLPFLTALHLTARRLWRCRPGGAFGYDPVRKNPVREDFVSLKNKTPRFDIADASGESL